ncbi:hypothetical protein QW180_25655 [Vibrio sinaloensis]|nr:hypothetical protein [Vibrio sinaloensis]
MALLLVSILLTSANVLAEQLVLITFNQEIQALRTNQVKKCSIGAGCLTLTAYQPDSWTCLKKSKHRHQFYRLLLNKSPSQMNAIWAKQSFSGKAIAPFEIAQESKQEIISWLKQNKNGVAYVPGHLVPEDAYVIYELQP